jgi:hypothetical protein
MSSLRSRTKAKSGSQPVRTWSLIRSRGHLLGFVEARDAKAAEARAVRAFDLTEYQRSRLIARERGSL